MIQHPWPTDHSRQPCHPGARCRAQSARVDAATVALCGAARLPAPAIVEIITWLSVLQLLHRLTRHVLPLPDRKRAHRAAEPALHLPGRIRLGDELGAASPDWLGAAPRIGAAVEQHDRPPLPAPAPLQFYE